MALRTRHYVREIAATHSPYVIDLVAGGFRWIINKAYVDLRYDREELDALYQMSQQYPLVFLPSHKSNFDHLILLYVLYENGLPPNHTAGGINMNFFPVGPFLRRSGVFFIRREFRTNDPYKFVLRQYIDYLLEKRFPLEWYIEGTRSRTGKLRAPRLGLLAYVVESFERGTADDVIFMPVSIAYDQIQDVGSYAVEQTGGMKQRESFGWFFRTLRGLRRRYGAAHIRFGAPISLRGFLATQDAPPVEADDAHNPAIPKLAFEVSARINEVTPVTPISLVTLALLSAGDRALTLDEVMEALDPFVAYVTARDLPVTEKLTGDDRQRVVAALSDLADHGVVTRFDGATDVIYRISREQHLSAAYYRNTIIHFFINSAIAELSLLKVLETDRPATAAHVIDEALRIRDLLKFEFFFAATDEFTDQIRAELHFHDGDWKTHVSDRNARVVLDTFHPFRSPAILRPFFDAYAVVGQVVESHAYESVLDSGALTKEALALGRQWLLQGRLRSPESVSLPLFTSALSLAANRGLLEPTADMVENRLTFAAELREIARRLEALESLEAAYIAGIVD
jgi:glycerol-3-phosphate O-acyltransferase